MKSFYRALPVILISFLLLTVVQLKVNTPMILLERFIPGGGWIEITLLSLFGGIMYHNLIDIHKTKRWRLATWLLFSIVFFSQLILGLMGYEKFLMTGNLHIPVPGIIIGGSVFRMELSFMPILLFITILITGPAWCSQLCYFGVIDNLAANKPKRNTIYKNAFLYKTIFFMFFIVAVLVLRFFNADIKTASFAGITFGIIGLAVIILSYRKGTMLHCTFYCPVNLIVTLGKYLNPFRMYIDNNCDNCMKCTTVCRYNALKKDDIQKHKPGLSCTYCGDCITSCHKSSIKYKLFNLSPEKSRNIYLATTTIVYIVFLAVARI